MQLDNGFVIADASWDVYKGKWAFLLGIEGDGPAEVGHFAGKAVGWGFVGEVKFDEADGLAEVGPKGKRKSFVQLRNIIYQ